MANLKGRSLFAAILVARAICGVGAAQAQWTVVPKTPLPGNTVTGTGGSLPDVGTVLYKDGGNNIIDNTVTMMPGSTSTAIQSFDAGANNVLDNGFIIAGTISRSPLPPFDPTGTAVLFNGATVSGNTLTVTKDGRISAPTIGVPTVAITGTTLNNNVVDNYGIISGTRYGVDLAATGSLTGNLVTNEAEGTITAAGSSGVGIGMASTSGGDIIGRTDPSGVLLDSIRNAGHVEAGVMGFSGSVGILAQANNITNFQVTNDGDIGRTNTPTLGIQLDASANITNAAISNHYTKAQDVGLQVRALGDIRGLVISSDHYVEAMNISGVGIQVLAEGNIGPDTLRSALSLPLAASVTNSGNLEAKGVGIQVEAGGNINDFHITNSGNISSDLTDHPLIGIKMDAYDGHVHGANLSNSGTILADEAGITLGALNGIDESTVTNTGSGVITVKADHTVPTYLVGIGLDTSGSLVTSSVTNAGSISVTDISGNFGNDAMGIVLHGYQGVTQDHVTNSGTLSVAVDGSGGILTGIALGSETGSVASNTVDNSGLIDVSLVGYGNDLKGIRLYSRTGVVASNTVTNSSAITVSLDGSGGSVNGSMSGIELYSEGSVVSSNTVTNSGSIDVSLDGSGGSIAGSMTGIELYSQGSTIASNTVTNSGSIHVSLNGPGGDLNGIQLQDTSGSIASNIVTNSGPGSSITVTRRLDASGNSVNVTGIGLLGSGNVVSNQVENQGLIRVAADVTEVIGAPGGIMARGISLISTNSYVNGNHATNASGATIDVSANLVDPSGGHYTLRAQGINLEAMGDVNGNHVTNASGATITATAYANNTGSVDARAWGVRLASDVSGSINGNTVDNAGTITALAHANTLTSSTDNGDRVRAFGIQLNDASGNISGNTVTNSGRVRATAQGDPSGNANVRAWGIQFGSEGDITGNTVTNTSSASITARAEGDPSGDANLRAYGIQLTNGSGNISGNTLSNAGSISATVQGDPTGNARVRAYGIQLGADAGNVTGNTLTNAGSITVTLLDGSGNVAPLTAGTYGATGIMLTAGDAEATPTAVPGDITGNQINLLTGSTITSPWDGIVLDAATGVDHNMVDGSGTISAGRNGIKFYSADETSGIDSNQVLLRTGSVVTATTGQGVFFEAAGSVDGNTISNVGTIHSGDTAIHLYSDTSSTDGNQILLGTGSAVTSDHGQGVSLEAAESADSNTVSNAGTLHSDGTAISITSGGTSSAEGNQVLLLSGSEVTSVTDRGVVIEGAGAANLNTVTNAGTLTAHGTAITIESGGTASADSNQVLLYAGSVVTSETDQGVLIEGAGSASSNTVSNAGTLASHNTAIHISADGANASQNTVTNSGSIYVESEGNQGIYVISHHAHADANIVTNSGLIRAGALPTTVALGELGDVDHVSGILVGGYQSASNNRITNASGGRIELADHSIGIGIGSYGDVSGNIVQNAGAITTGDTSIGIGIGTYGDLSGNSVVLSYNSVENIGSITTGPLSVGIGIGGLGLTADHNSVSNSGIITAGGTRDGSFNAVAGIVIGGAASETDLTEMEWDSWPFELTATALEGSSVSNNTVTNTSGVHVTSGVRDISANAIAGGILVAGLAETVEHNTVTNASGASLTVSAIKADMSGNAIAGGIVIGGLSAIDTEDNFGPLKGSTFSSNTVANDGTISVASTSLSATTVAGEGTVAAGGVLLVGVGETMDLNKVTNNKTLSVTASTLGPNDGGVVAGGVLLAGMAEKLDQNEVTNASGAAFSVSASTHGSGDTVAAVGVVLGGLAYSELEPLIDKKGATPLADDGSSISLNKVTNAGTFAVSASTAAGESQMVLAGGILLGGMAETVDTNEVHNTGQFTVTATTDGSGNTAALGILLGGASALDVLEGDTEPDGLMGSVSHNVITNSSDFTVTATTNGSGMMSLAGGALIAGAADTMDSNTVENSGTMTVTSALHGAGLASGALGVLIGGLSPTDMYPMTYDPNAAKDELLTTSLSKNAVTNASGASILVSAATDGSGSMVAAGGILVAGMSEAVDENVVNNYGTLHASATAGGSGNAIAAGVLVGGFSELGLITDDPVEASGSVSTNRVTNTDEIVVNASVNGTGSELVAGGVLIGGVADVMDSNQVTNASGAAIQVTASSNGSTFGVAAGVLIGGVANLPNHAPAAVGADTSVSQNSVTNDGVLLVSLTDPSGHLFGAGIVIGQVGMSAEEITADGDGLIASISGNTVTNNGTLGVRMLDASGNPSHDVAYGAGIMIGSYPYHVSGEDQAISGNLVTNASGARIDVIGSHSSAIFIGNLAHVQWADPPVSQPTVGTFGNTVTNSGVIAATGNDTYGIQIADDYGVSTNAITNSLGSSIVVTGNYGYGVSLDSGGNTANSVNNTLTNRGTIRTIGEGGSAVYFNGISSSTIDNWGTIEASGATNRADGVSVYGNGNTITNWGKIAGDGSGNGICVNGSGNVVNLEGHSSVVGYTPVLSDAAAPLLYGKITGVGGTDEAPLNTLNLDFTGVSVEKIAEITAALDGKTSGEFTLRGVHYIIDPMIINLNLSSYELQGETGNQSAVGGGLDSLASNPEPGSPLWLLLNHIDDLSHTPGEVPKALEAMSPQRYQLYGDIAVATMNSVSQQVNNRLVALYDGDMPEKKTNLWATLGHKSATVDSNTRDLEDAKFSTDSMVVGADYRVSPAFTLGALFHYSTTDHAKLDENGSQADVDSKGVGVYAGFRQGGAYVNGLMTYSNNDYTSRRTIEFTGYDYTAKGSTSGHQTGVGIDGGYDFKVSDALTVGPFAALQYVHLGVDGFKEKGAPLLALDVNSQTMTSLLGRVGGRLNYTANLGGLNTFALDLHAALQHEFKNDSRNITASFIGMDADSFSVKTSAPDRNSFLLGVGFNFNFHGTTSVFANYDMQGGQSNVHEQSIKGGVKISF